LHLALPSDQKGRLLWTNSRWGRTCRRRGRSGRRRHCWDREGAADLPWKVACGRRASHAIAGSLVVAEEEALPPRECSLPWGGRCSRRRWGLGHPSPSLLVSPIEGCGLSGAARPPVGNQEGAPAQPPVGEDGVDVLPPSGGWRCRPGW
jgi:hypothetical protein